MPRPTTPTLTPYTSPLPDVNNPATWAERTRLFWNWVTGDGYDNIADVLAYSEDVADYLDTALGGSETLIDSVAAIRTRAYVLATYGGTANAITLTTGQALSPVPGGVTYSFFATASNTGNTTVTIDGTSFSARTETGAELPAGYIRTGVVTECWRSGSIVIVDRKIERGSNANGTFIRYADGAMSVTKRITGLGPITVASGSNFNLGGGIAIGTLAATFSAAPIRTVDVVGTAAWCLSTTSGPTTTGGGNISLVSSTSSASTAYEVNLTFEGRWY